MGAIISGGGPIVAAVQAYDGSFSAMAYFEDALTRTMNKDISLINQKTMVCPEHYINSALFLITFPCVRMKGGKTALMYAAEAGHLELVKKLLEHGIDVNATSMVRINRVDRTVYSFYREAYELLHSHFLYHRRGNLH